MFNLTPVTTLLNHDSTVNAIHGRDYFTIGTPPPNTDSKSVNSVLGTVVKTLPFFLFPFALLSGCEQAKVNPKVLERLIQNLQSNEVDVRKKATEELGKVRKQAKEAVPWLIRLLRDKDEGVRKATIETLVKIGPDAVRALLIQGVKDAKEDIHSSVADTLIKIGSRAIPELIQALKDSDKDIRWATAEVLGGMKATSAISALIQALKDNEEFVRRKVAEALGLIGAKASSATPALIQTLSDSSWHVRYNSAEALGMIGVRNQNVITALKGKLNDPDRHVRNAVRKALERLEKR